ncbi:MAG: alpha/beta hydrolase [Ilumatobacteraceae bacterium]|nr:alpha/beta hydrolase [Ilumatobacteraceae bacterium]
MLETFTSFDGTTIAYRQWGTEYGEVPVVLHHGFAADSLTNWVTPGVADRIVADGRWVVALDARGHGRSDKPHTVDAYGDDQMATDVSWLIDHLEVQRVDLVGYSMGGHVALDVATRERRLRSVVIGGIGGSALLPGTIDRSGIAAALRAPRAEDVEDRMSRWFRRFAESTGADLEALAAVASAGGHRAEGVELITIPVLVLAGADDPLAVGADQIAAAIPGAQYVVVPGDHLSAVGVPQFADAIVSFLQAQQRRG